MEEKETLFTAGKDTNFHGYYRNQYGGPSKNWNKTRKGPVTPLWNVYLKSLHQYPIEMFVLLCLLLY